IASGAASSARTPVAASAVALNLAAARGAYWTHAMIASTGTTAHAVVLIAQATASTRAALTTLPRSAQASARQVSAMTGGSVTPSASGKAITGEATASAGAPAVGGRAGGGEQRGGCGGRPADAGPAWGPERQLVRRGAREGRGDQHDGGEGAPDPCVAKPPMD